MSHTITMYPTYEIISIYRKSYQIEIINKLDVSQIRKLMCTVEWIIYALKGLELMCSENTVQHITKQLVIRIYPWRWKIPLPLSHLSLMTKKYVLDNNAGGKIFLQIIKMNIIVFENTNTTFFLNFSLYFDCVVGMTFKTH